MVKTSSFIRRESPTPNPDRFPFRLVLLFGLLIIILATAKEFVQYNEEGKPELSPDRQAKLSRELEELEHSEQYALLAAKNGDYPCYHCIGKSTIFLHRGEVWKYGVTRKGEKRRYGEWHVDQGLFYVIQYEGLLQECLKREKLMIYHYALLPENIARITPLIRPPGNKQDN